MSTVTRPRSIVGLSYLKHPFLFTKATKRSEPSYLAFMLEQKGTSFHQGFTFQPYISLSIISHKTKNCVRPQIHLIGNPFSVAIGT